MGPVPMGPWPKMDVIIFYKNTIFWKNIFWRNRPFLWSPKPETRTKMTANGLSSYELFIKMSTFSRQKLNFPSVFGVFWKTDVRFYEKVIFWFDRTFGPFLMILCFYLCTPSGYYFFKIMTSWLILTSFCEFLGLPKHGMKKVQASGGSDFWKMTSLFSFWWFLWVFGLPKHGMKKVQASGGSDFWKMTCPGTRSLNYWETRGTPTILEILPTPVPTRTWAEISQSWKPLTGTRQGEDG